MADKIDLKAWAREVWCLANSGQLGESLPDPNYAPSHQLLAIEQALHDAVERAAQVAAQNMSDDYCEECKGHGEERMLHAIRSLISENDDE